MIAPSRLVFSAWLFLAVWPTQVQARHVLLDKVLSDNPPPGQSDASCAHLVRAGLDEGVDAKGRPLVEPEVHHMVNAMRKSWWQCASAVANALAKYGSEVENAFQMEQRSITKNLNEIRSALEKGKPVQSISPAFEWAQSGDWVYINAKMSHKLDAPATLNVVSEGVEIAERSLKFAASKDQKRFALDLALYADIDPEPSSISWGSVGRVTFMLKKAEGGVVWSTLLAEGQKKPVNMHVWWTKQEEHADEIDAIEEATSEAEAKAAKSNVGDVADNGNGSGESSDESTGGEGAGGDDAGAAAAAATGDGARGKKPLTPEARLKKAKKEATMVLNKERKDRFEELEKEKRAATKAIDAEAASKKKEADEALQAKKLAVHEQIDELVKKKHAEIEASWKTEL